MDIIDLASDREMADRELALKSQRATCPAGASASHCHQCDEPIPLGRQEAIPGVTLCIECQSILERQGRVYA